MKKIYKYSEKKFLNFTEKKQIAIISEMLQVLEINFRTKEYASLLQDSLSECLLFLENSDSLLKFKWNKYDLTQLSDVIALRDSLLKSKDLALKDNDIFIKRYDSVKENTTKFPLVIILDNLRSAFNVGSIIRSSECLGVLEIALCGNTPDAENRKVQETAMGTAGYVQMVKCPSVHQAILTYRHQGYEIIALELTNNSLPLEKFQPASKVALILGNESLGLAEETLAKCDKVIEISMYGVKNSLNVSNTAAIAIHNITQKMEKIK